MKTRKRLTAYSREAVGDSGPCFRSLLLLNDLDHEAQDSLALTYAVGQQLSLDLLGSPVLVISVEIIQMRHTR